MPSPLSTATPAPLPRGCTWASCGHTGVSACQLPSRRCSCSCSPPATGTTASKRGRGSQCHCWRPRGRLRRSTPASSNRNGPGMVWPGSSSRRRGLLSPSHVQASWGCRLLEPTRLDLRIGRLKRRSRAAGPELALLDSSSSSRGGRRSSSCCCSKARASPAASTNVIRCPVAVMVPGAAWAGQSA